MSGQQQARWATLRAYLLALAVQGNATALKLLGDLPPNGGGVQA